MANIALNTMDFQRRGVQFYEGTATISSGSTSVETDILMKNIDFEDNGYCELMVAVSGSGTPTITVSFKNWGGDHVGLESSYNDLSPTITVDETKRYDIGNETSYLRTSRGIKLKFAAASAVSGDVTIKYRLAVR
ncbi:MAG: hypothetical protein GXO75_16210 [Calditrichaeota bacterium]|nr:hypothetical protein [Calditrichota bacterium]